MNEGNPVRLMGLDAPWKGAALSKKLPEGTLYVNAYTDIEKPTTRSAPAGSAGTVTVPTGSMILASNWNLIPRSGGGYSGAGSFNGAEGTVRCQGGCGVENGRTTSGTWSFTPSRPPGAQDVPMNAAGVVFTEGLGLTEELTEPTAGTFNGRAGSFRCVKLPCGVSEHNNRITELRGEWIFVPSSGSTTLTDKDTDYLAGGIWLYVPDTASSTDAYEFGAFADGSDPFTQSNIMALTGSATYVGDAVGVYSEKGASSTTVEGFDGDVTLTADFGTADSLGTISGSITNFEVDGEASAGSLTLGEAAIGSANSGFFKGAVTGSDDSRTYAGKWGGQFFGNGAASTDHPGSVAGTFGGTSTDDAVNFVGAFGAHVVHAVSPSPPPGL